ncbi:MAG: ACT domain-containing protein [Lachnospiraceae bacterium]|nr:ACT domain-containing protein [Lachnospiraceae bacterium]
MLEEYLIVHKSILPDYYQKVVQARDILSTHPERGVSDVVKEVGISRSTYYKYKDYIFLPEGNLAERRAVINLVLFHEAGTLSNCLNLLSSLGINVLTISQSIPVADKANVTISMDISNISCPMDTVLSKLKDIKGVKKATLFSIE